MRPVRLNPYHPLARLITHAIVFEGKRSIDLTGKAYKYSRPADIGFVDPRFHAPSGLPGVRIQESGVQGQVSYLEPLDPEVAGSEFITTLEISERVGALTSAGFSLQRATPVSAARFGVVPTTVSWVRYYVDDGRMSYDSAPNQVNAHGMSYDGTIGTVADRLKPSLNGEAVGSLFGTIPTSLDSSLARIYTGESPSDGVNGTGQMFVYLVMNGIALPQSDIDKYTGDMARIGALFRGPRIWIVAPPAAAGPDVTGSGTPTEAADTASGTGEIEHTGSGTPSEAADTASGSGSVGADVSGSGSPTESADTASGVGEISHVGSGTPSESADIASGAGAVTGLTKTGSGSPTEGSDIANGLGTAPSKGGGWATNQRRLQRLANLRRDDEEVIALLGILGE